MLYVLGYVFLETTCGFVGDCHLDVGAKEGIEIALSELALVLEAAIGSYFR